MNQIFDINSIPGGGELTQKVGIAFDDEGSPTAGFVIVGKDSEQCISADQRVRIANIKRQSTKATRLDASTDGGAAKVDKLVYDNDTEKAVAVVVDWFGFTDQGAPAEFSPAKIRAMFVARPTWREKVLVALENEAAFLPNSLTT